MIMPLTLCAQEYAPLTKDEVVAWLETQTFPELVDFIIIADDWERSQPEVNFPTVYAILDKDGNLYITFENSMSMIIGTIHPLQYRWKIPDLVIEEFYVEKKKSVWPWFVVGGGGILIGMIINSLIN